jgi:hypothetical protein
MAMRAILSILLLYTAGFLTAQTRVRVDSISPTGAWARMEVELGDTVFVMMLRPVRISEKRNFENQAEMRQYYIYARAAKKVYPYAVQALDIYNEWQEDTADLRKRKRRKVAKEEQKAIQEQFEERLRKFTKTEGKVLVKMLERETGKSFFDLIKEMRGGPAAVYWTNLSRVWGYDLKEGYILGDDPLLDEVLVDYDFGKPLR